MDAADAFRAHYGEVYRYAVHLTGDADAAADVAQEVFHRYLERPPDAVRPRAWLFTVATNLVRQQARTRTRRQRLLDGAVERAAVSDPPVRPDVHAETQEVKDAVLRALGALSPREREILMLYRDGHTHAEIAGVIGKSVPSIGTRIARALRKFDAALGEDREVLR